MKLGTAISPIDVKPEATPVDSSVDIGSGGGIPAIIVGLAFPSLELLLIERTKKKALFLEQMVDRLNLRAEVIARDFRETLPVLSPASFEGGLMRLIRLDKKILRGALGLLKPSGTFVWYGDLNRLDYGLAGPVICQRYGYYLNDLKQLRSFAVFSRSD